MTLCYAPATDRDANSYSVVCSVVDCIIRKTDVPSLRQEDVRECTNPTETLRVFPRRHSEIVMMQQLQVIKTYMRSS